MKRILSTTLGILLCSALFSQSQITVPEPETDGQAVYLEQGTICVALQQEVIGFDSRLNGAAYTPFKKREGVNIYIVVPGKSSPNRIAATTDPIRFILRVPNNSIDPYSFIRIALLDQKKKERRAEFIDATLKHANNNVETTFIPYYATKYGESSYLIEIDPAVLASNGQYIIVYDGPGADGISRKTLNTFSYNAKE